MTKLLPKINSEIGKSIVRDYERDPKYLSKLVLKLADENPCVLDFIDKMSDMSKDPKAVLRTSLLVYRMLESQAEADKLNEEYN